MSLEKLNNKLEQHIISLEDYKVQEDDKFDRLLSNQQENTDDI